MTLKERLAEYVCACFTGLWIESHEHEDALRDMAQLCVEQNWQLATWNIDTGLVIGQLGDNDEQTAATDRVAQPLRRSKRFMPLLAETASMSRGWFRTDSTCSVPTTCQSPTPAR